MRAIKLTTHVSEDRTLHLQLPEDVQEGPAEVIVLVPEGARSSGHTLRDFLLRLRSSPRFAPRKTLTGVWKKSGGVGSKGSSARFRVRRRPRNRLYRLQDRRPSPPSSRKGRPHPGPGGRAPVHQEVRDQPHREQRGEHPLLDSRAICASYRLAALLGAPPSSGEPQPAGLASRVTRCERGTGCLLRPARPSPRNFGGVEASQPAWTP
jgi:hypothetical protein